VGDSQLQDSAPKMISREYALGPTPVTPPPPILSAVLFDRPAAANFQLQFWNCYNQLTQVMVV